MLRSRGSLPPIRLLYSLVERNEVVVEIRRRPINIKTGYRLIDFLITLFYHSFCVFTGSDGKQYCLEYNSNEDGILYKPLVTIMLTEYTGDDNSKVIDSGVVPLYSVILQLSDKYKPGTYFFLTRNCQHFTDDIRKKFNKNKGVDNVWDKIGLLRYPLILSSICYYIYYRMW